MTIEYGKAISTHQTNIDGLVVVDLAVHGDNRGWFKENFQRAKMTELGAEHSLPDIKIVQNNISFNAKRGVTRGIHAEPWDKFISVATGSIFGAWCDLRAGSATYGEVFTTVIDPSKAIFVPRGVGNSFQALEDNTAYTYLVNDHWSQDLQSQYTFVNLADPELGIKWPIPLDSEDVELSDKDKSHPMLADIEPMLPKKTLVIGANGQLGRAVRAYVSAHSVANGGTLYPETFIFTDVASGDGIAAFDATNEADYAQFSWSNIGTIINCAAYTAVDNAETDEGRPLAWKINAIMPGILAKVATEHSITLVHVSSDYVFDGSKSEWREDDSFAPLGIYAQTKAAGDIAVATTPKHYILRTSWVIGDGSNFVKTMKSLADKGIKPQVVGDQFGRLTFTKTLAEAIFHLISVGADYGTYNATNSGETASWAKIAADVYELSGKSRDDVTAVSTEEYFAGKLSEGVKISPRPAASTLSLNKLESTGYHPTPWEAELEEYFKTLP